MKFTALLHHLTVALLRDSFYALKRKAAPGVDGITWEEYETGLEGRLLELHSRVHRGAYRAQPSRRVFIPKPDGRQRLLGVAALEDKVVQQAVVTILNQIYEEDFRGTRMASGQGAVSIKRWMRCSWDHGEEGELDFGL
jgi:retron-type reverse transcriptase